MINIPTELLRTFITVVDLRSFTKAAQSLGVTQPAVSAQIKRLQLLLGTDLLDKSAPGVSLTSAGEMVIAHARRLLSINDQILDLSNPNATTQAMRIGINCDYVAAAITRALACYRASHPEMRFSLHCGGIDSLLREVREGDLDIAFGVSVTAPETQYRWADELVWLRGCELRLDPTQPVPLISYSEECFFFRTAVEALGRAGLRAQLVYSAPSITGLCAAAVSGLGIMVLPGSHIEMRELVVCDDAALPQLADAHCGLYVRQGGGSDTREHVARTLADALRPRGRAGQNARGIPDPSLTVS